jgi:hypothetical protein
MAQFVVNQRQELAGGARIALLEAVEEVRDVRHRRLLVSEGS